MAKSLVEKYRQILESDPGSLVFIELAKALLDEGEATAAAEVCVSGLEHHPDSVVGHVLHGKALLNMGHPDRAMAEFDQAIEIDRDNPYAYNLIGEVLLHKGLHRSALPILKRAVALQPTDRRVKQWLEQAQRAVGDSAPEDDQTVPGRAREPSEPTLPGISDIFKSMAAREAKGAASPLVPSADTGIPAAASPSTPAAKIAPEAASPAGTSGGASNASDGFAPGAPPSTGRSSPAGQPPVTASASRPPPARDAQPEAPAESAAGLGGSLLPDLPDEPAEPSAPGHDVERTPVPGGDDAGPANSAAAAQPRPLSPPVTTSASKPPPARRPEPAEEAGAKSEPVAAPRASPPPLGSGPSSAAAEPESSASVAPPPPVGPPPLKRRTTEPNIQVSADLFGPPPLPGKPPPKAPPLPKRSRSGLLADLPEEPLAPSSPPPPAAPAIAPETAENIAREYEAELRARLLAAPPASFWRKNWLVLSLSAALLVAAIIGGAIYQGTRKQNQGRDLADLRSKALRALTLETPTGYRDALELADQVLALSPSDPSAHAVAAFANAVLFAEQGNEPGRRAAAQKASADIRDAHPGFALATGYFIAKTPTEIEAARKPILETAAEKLPSGFEGAVVLSLAGRLLLANGDIDGALAKFKAATDAYSNHVATLLALGDYYRGQADLAQAARFFGVAKNASPEHVLALLGAADAALETGEGDYAADLERARKALEAAAQAEAPWPAAARTEFDLLEGRSLAHQGNVAEAVTRLSAGATQHKDRAADFYAALGSVEGMSGDYAAAAKSYRRALERRPSDPAAREQLARALIASGKPAEALKALDNVGDERRLRVMRGLARLEMGQLAKAREEILATRRSGKLLPEAAVYLAMIDLAQGQRDTARSVLENVARSVKSLGVAHVALGRLHEQEDRATEAVAAYTAAAATPRDWEGACSLGRLHLKSGRLEDARAQLELALKHNRAHTEARLALAEALLGLGDVKKAQSELEQAAEDGAGAAAQRGLARCALAQADLPLAKKHVQAALRLDPRSPESTRLLAQLSLASGDAQDALRGLERAARANPRDATAWCDLGEVEAKVGSAAAAQKAFAAALKVDRTNLRARIGMLAASLPRGARAGAKEAEAIVAAAQKAEPALRARALAVAARVSLTLGERTKATQRTKAAIEAFDGSAEAHLAAALVARLEKDHSTATAELQRVVALDPTLAEAHLALADSLGRDPDQVGRAIQELEAYLRLSPKGADAPYARKMLLTLRKKASKG